jgi:hypothetical protein
MEFCIAFSRKPSENASNEAKFVPAKIHMAEVPARIRVERAGADLSWEYGRFLPAEFIVVTRGLKIGFALTAGRGPPGKSGGQDSFVSIIGGSLCG